MSVFCNVIQLLKFFRKIFNGVVSYHAITLSEKSIQSTIHILTQISWFIYVYVYNEYKKSRRKCTQMLKMVIFKQN